MNRQLALASTLATAQSAEELLCGLRKCADSVGATEVNVALIPSLVQGTPASFAATTFAPQFVAQVDADPRLAKRSEDPVSRHIRTAATPIFWGRDTYAARGLVYDWELFSDAGAGSGVGMALHLASDRHFICGLMWRDQGLRDKNSNPDLAVALQTMAVFAEPAAFRLANIGDLPLGDSTLSTRELQCLFWASRGLTDEDTAAVLQVSHRTVRKHIDAAVCKLGAINRTHAAVTATRKGLFSADLASL